MRTGTRRQPGEGPLLDLSALRRPTLVVVTSPSCPACRAMGPDLEAAAGEFSDSVDLVRVDAALQPETARHLGVRATPTLLGVRDGRLVVRVVGRRSRRELTDLTAGLVGSAPLTPSWSVDSAIRAAAGVVLVGVGFLAGPSVPLIAVGVVALLWAARSHTRWRRE